MGVWDPDPRAIENLHIIFDSQKASVGIGILNNHSAPSVETRLEGDRTRCWELSQEAVTVGQST